MSPGTWLFTLPQPCPPYLACSIITEEHTNVYMVHRQAMAMDRGQLVIVRAMMGAFCEQPGIAKVSGKHTTTPCHQHLHRLGGARAPADLPMLLLAQ